MTVHARKDLNKAKRILVKIGSSSISNGNESNIDVLVNELAKLYRGGAQVLLVTSGAIATGMPLLSLEQKPADLPTAQALAAVGQSRLMARYQSSLERFGWVSGQILLTSEDLAGEETRNNARDAINRLLELGVLPIVNENDTVATAEIRFGDNDRLAALVAVLLEVDAVILLSDIDALYDHPPTESNSKAIIEVVYEDDLSWIEVGGSSTGVGTGGAVTKVAAAKLANDAGIPVLLTNLANIDRALAGESVGTWFQAK